VRRTIVATLGVAPEVVFPAVADLSTYPAWMGLVRRADPVATDLWSVTLRATVGPFARSKRLTMRRVHHEPNAAVRFERDEQDGRRHAAWVLAVRVTPVRSASATEAQRSEVAVALAYDGALWSGPLELVLGRQVDEAVPRLEEYLQRAGR
jgi:hypothetical protein